MGLLDRVDHNLAVFGNAFATGGVRGLAKALEKFAIWRLDPRKRAFQRALKEKTAAGRAFDARHGTDTAGEVLLHHHGVSVADVERGNGSYRAVWPDVFRAAMAAVDVDFARYTFIDYGSGKGKAMLLAADYPFRRVLGIEFAPGLHEIALRNVGLYHGDRQRCVDLEPLHRDALDYDPPLEPLLCFFFNPFDDATLRCVLRRLVASFDSAPRSMLLAYTNMRDVAEQRHVFDHEPRVVHLAREDTGGPARRFIVYEIVGAQTDKP